MRTSRRSRGPLGLCLSLDVLARVDAIGRRFEVSRSAVLRALLAVAMGDSERLEDALRLYTVNPGRKMPRRASAPTRGTGPSA